jgi:RNA polymerase sigma factor (sigma-70 family)
LAAFVAVGRRETLIGELARKWQALGRSEVEDAVDHAIAEAAHALRATREAAIYDYLRTAAQRALGRRKERAGRVSAPVAADVNFDCIVGDALSPEDALLAKEHRQIVLDLVSALDDRTLAVMRLKHVEGLERKEVAEVLGISEKAVKKAIEKGLRLCRENFEAAIGGQLCESRSHALRTFAAGTAGIRERRQAEQHLAHCRSCRDLHRAVTVTQRAAAALVPAPGLMQLHAVRGLARIAHVVRTNAHGLVAKTSVGGKTAAVAAAAALAGTAITVAPQLPSSHPSPKQAQVRGASRTTQVTGTVETRLERHLRLMPPRQAKRPRPHLPKRTARAARASAPAAHTGSSAARPLAPAPALRPSLRPGEFPVL